MSLGLSHSLSRYKLKFSPDKVDTMIVQVRHGGCVQGFVCRGFCAGFSGVRRLAWQDWSFGAGRRQMVGFKTAHTHMSLTGSFRHGGCSLAAAVHSSNCCALLCTLLCVPCRLLVCWVFLVL
jgi:hypothetical protein